MVTNNRFINCFTRPAITKPTSEIRFAVTRYRSSVNIATISSTIDLLSDGAVAHQVDIADAHAGNASPLTKTVLDLDCVEITCWQRHKLDLVINEAYCTEPFLEKLFFHLIALILYSLTPDSSVSQFEVDYNLLDKRPPLQPYAADYLEPRSDHDEEDYD